MPRTKPTRKETKVRESVSDGADTLMKPKVSDTLSPETLAQSDAARAIALCRIGAVGDGIALYPKMMKRYHGATLPVGVHLKLLQSFGLHDAADIIRRSASASEDLCFSAA